MYSLNKNYENIYLSDSMGPGKSMCDIFSGNTQGNSYLI